MPDYTPDQYQALALETWYSPDDPRYLDPRHPLIKLAGEAGEILDLFGKHEYKPNFSWWDCKHCKRAYNHYNDGVNLNRCEGLDTYYTPLVLDELGDYFYYLRILTWQKQLSFVEVCKKFEQVNYNMYYSRSDLLYSLTNLSLSSSDLLFDWIINSGESVGMGGLKDCTFYFLAILSKLNCNIDHLTELNYTKLNSKPGAHGWKATQRESEGWCH